MKSKLLILFIPLFTIFSSAQEITTNRNPVGLEHNVLFNAHKHYKVTVTPENSLNINRLFDGKFSPYYTNFNSFANEPITVLIENLPNDHTQVAGYIGWSTRYYGAKRFKIEGYNVSGGKNEWVVLADYSSIDYSDNEFVAKVAQGGGYTKLKYTFYEASNTEGNLGISELFFINQEAVSPYQGLFSEFKNQWTENDNGLYYNGNVGIGTVSPEYKLVVNGTLKTHSMLIGIPNRIKDWNSICESGFYSCSGDVSNAPETNAFFWGINIGGGSTTDSKLGGQLLIRHLSSGNPVMYFRNRTQNGEGTWAKVLHNQGKQEINGALTVDGTIQAKEVKVQTDVWSDFVFAPDYNLPSLQEVESFIKENNHLPGVPSEKEVLAEGIDLAAMNAVLLQKIEELTLYIIEQQEELSIQKQEIKELKLLIE